MAAGRRGGEPAHQRASADRWGSSAGTHVVSAMHTLCILHPRGPLRINGCCSSAFSKPSEAPSLAKRLSITVASQDSTMALGLNTEATEQKPSDTIYCTTEKVSPEKRLSLFQESTLFMKCCNTRTLREQPFQPAIGSVSHCAKLRFPAPEFSR